jgi:hypothetical protein
VAVDIYFSCSKGHALVVDPEYAGRRVRCPLCLEIVTAPLQSAAPAVAAVATTLPQPPPALERTGGYDVVQEEPRPRPGLPAPRDREEDDYPRKRKGGKKRERRAQLNKVDLGLAFHYWKYLSFVLAIFLRVAGNLLAFGLPPLALLLIGVSWLGTFTAPILGIVGSVLCASVPPKSQARVLVLLSLGFDAAALGAPLLALLTILIPPVALVFLLLALVFGITGFVLFMYFLKRLAYYLHDAPAGEEAIAAMAAYLGVLFGGLVVMFITVAALIRPAPIVALVLGGLESIVWTVFLIQALFRILNVISNLRARL